MSLGLLRDFLLGRLQGRASGVLHSTANMGGRVGGRKGTRSFRVKWDFICSHVSRMYFLTCGNGWVCWQIYGLILNFLYSDLNDILVLGSNFSN